MKITKRQLRRIIKEEKASLLAETRDQADQNLKQYQDGWHGKDMSSSQAALESAIYLMLGDLTGSLGLSEEEAAEIVLDAVHDVLGT